LGCFYPQWQFEYEEDFDHHQLQEGAELIRNVRKEKFPGYEPDVEIGGTFQSKTNWFAKLTGAALNEKETKRKEKRENLMAMINKVKGGKKKEDEIELV